MVAFTMAVGCDCEHPTIHYMNDEGIFQFDNGDRGYAWICPHCNRRICVRLNYLETDE